MSKKKQKQKEWKKQKNRQIYIVVSQTGTILSRILKALTHAKYNHASIAFDDELENMYSFGRLNPYNPVVGGLVRESTHFGTFKRFADTEAVVLEIDVDERTYSRLILDVNEMYDQKKKYHYNYLGLFAAFFGVQVRQKRCFYCSEFVKYLLKKHKIVKKNSLCGITKPMDFLSLSNAQVKLSRLESNSCVALTFSTAALSL